MLIFQRPTQQRGDEAVTGEDQGCQPVGDAGQNRKRHEHFDTEPACNQQRGEGPVRDRLCGLADGQFEFSTLSSALKGRNRPTSRQRTANVIRIPSIKSLIARREWAVTLADYTFGRSIGSKRGITILFLNITAM